MNAIKATWKNGQIIPEEPVTWREGSRLVVREESPDEFEFMTEAEQGGIVGLPRNIHALPE